MVQVRSALIENKSGCRKRREGFILLEVLVAMLILELGILALADVFLSSTMMARQMEQQIRMLYALRGEMELLEKTPLNELPSIKTKTFDDFQISISVTKYDENKDGIVDYRKMYVKVYPKDRPEVRRYFEFVTYRSV